VADVLDWLFALNRYDVLLILAAIGLLVQGWQLGALAGRVDHMRSELEQRGVL
jgi:hypothetical protein